jgi:sulfur-carrier protein
VHVTVRLFARLRDLVGAGELTREVPPGATVRTVWDDLAREYPAIAPYAESMSCAVNIDYARMTTAVSDGDEVAFLPPVSGG